MGRISEPFDVKKYNIQKGIGVYSINMVIAECIERKKEKDLSKFEAVIMNCALTKDSKTIENRG